MDEIRKEATILAKDNVQISYDKSEMLKYIEDFVNSNKCNDIKSYYIKSMDVWFVVVSVDSDKYASAIAKRLLSSLKENFNIDRYRVEGSTNWVILDVDDCLVHIFRTEVREYYNVDELWGKISNHNTSE